MDDLISRSALLERLDKVAMPDDLYSLGIQRGVEHAKEVISEAPAVDAVAVVRCRDCVHYEFGFCTRSILYSKSPNGYCENGERRADHDQA